MIYGNKYIEEVILPITRHADKSLINPASMNITLGSQFLIPIKNNEGITLGEKVPYVRYLADLQTGCPLEPGEFILATTQQYFHIPSDCAAFVQGRSSIGRAGLSIQNAGFIDPGFEGEITLELKNESPNIIILTAGYPVGQLVFFACHDVTKPYRGKYYRQTGATGSRMYLDGINKERNVT